MSKVSFKHYDPGQMALLPEALDDLVPADHPVRVVNEVIDRVDIAPLIERFKGGGTSSYHPRMMLKALVYAYLSNIYSSRRIEACLRENVHFMWLAAKNMPDHNTIARFRSERLRDVLEPIFTEVVVLLVEAGHVRLEEAYVDGTVMRADAHPYSFVWKRSVERNEAQLRQQLRELWEHAQQVANEEMEEEDPPDFDRVDPEEMDRTIERIDRALEGKKKELPQKDREKLSRAKREFSARLERYEEQKRAFEGRSSFSKTDPDATFLAEKGSWQGRPPLRPFYNLQISSHDRFVLHYSLHRTPSDDATLEDHLQGFRARYDRLPEKLVGDAGYGSANNYEMLEREGITPYVKYKAFEGDRRGTRRKKDPYHQDHLSYDAKKDRFTCPAGEPMDRVGEKVRGRPGETPRKVHHYQARDCTGCELRSACHGQDHDRSIEVDHALRRYKQEVYERLTSPEGVKARKRRNHDVETVFGIIKQNKGFRRFLMRGLEKVRVETGLLALAHNLKRLADLKKGGADPNLISGLAVA